MRFSMMLPLIFFSVAATAQQETELEVEAIIEAVADDAPDDYDYSELTERLNQYRRSPLNLNTATPGQLEELRLLNPVLIAALQEHIRESGRMMAVEELQAVPGFTEAIIARLRPFVTAGDGNTVSSLKQAFFTGKNEVMLRYGQTLQKQQGFTKTEGSRYLGDPGRYLFRYRYNAANRILLAINARKDAGEPFFTGENRYGFDFYSGSLAITNPGRLKKLVIGDYALQFGQGLAMFTGFGFGKGADVTTIPRVSRGLLPYTSTNKLQFLRGASATIAAGNFSFTPFVSLRKLDARIEGEPGEVMTLGTSGYHRTETEMANKATLSSRLFGANAAFTSGGVQFGALIYQSSFSHPFSAGTRMYDQFDFASGQLLNASAYGSYSFRNWYFFGEAARANQSDIAFIGGAMAALSPSVSVVIMQRNYPRNYQSFYNQAISENSRAVNERGFYSGVTARMQKWTLTGYADVFRFPWLKYRVDAPGWGHELLGQLSYQPDKRSAFYLRYRFREKPQNASGDAQFPVPEDVAKQNLRLDALVPAGADFTLHYRGEHMRFAKSGDRQNGYLLLQDIIYKPPYSGRWSAALRAAWFKTDSYDSRLYAFEQDVLYSFTVPPYYNKGFRTYLNTRFHLGKGLDMWGRYALFSYRKQEVIGSGLDQIDGNRKSEVKFQMRYQF